MLSLLAALFAGLLFPLAFSPTDWSYLAFLSLALLFFSWRDASPGQAFLRGYGFGLGQFGLGVSWVFVSMKVYGGASLPEAIALTGAFVLFLALYPALAGYLAARLSRGAGRAPRLLVVFPALWILSEWLRGWLFTGFAWLEVGTTQVDTVFGQGLAPVLGVYGVGYVVALSSGAMLLVTDPNPRHRLGVSLLVPATVAVSMGLSQVHWVQPAGAPFRVSLLQGNISQDIKWQPEVQHSIVQQYMDLTRQHWDSRLIIWPETAVPAFYHQVREPFLRELEQEARQHGADLLIGVPVADESERRYYNGLVSLGKVPGMYYKRHLVPFGEFLPLRFMLGFILEWLQIPMADFSSGSDEQSSLVAAGYPLSASICYEDIFAAESVHGLPAAAFQVNVTNDAWFGDSWAPHQHLQMARMRALESGRYLLRATNTGVTAIIAPRGDIVLQAPLFERAVLTGMVLPMTGETPFVMWTNWPTMSSLLMIILIFLVGRKRFHDPAKA